MDARRYLCTVLLISFCQQSRAVETIYTTCDELMSRGAIELSIPEADTQDLIDANPSQYTDRIGLAVTDGVTIRFSSVSISEKYPASEYFQFVEGERTDVKGSQWLIQLLKPIDRESGVNVLDYRAQCMEGVQQTVIYLSLKIAITDQNDNSPIFNQRNYVTTIVETIPVGTEVVTVTATDRDLGVNKDINYSLNYVISKPLTVRCQFIISQPNTGIISVGGSLIGTGDTQCTYTVIASDGGTPPRTATAQVQITIRGAANTGPAFEYPDCIPDEFGYCLYPAYTTSIATSWTGKLTVYTVPAPGSSEGVILALDKDGSSALKFFIADTDAYKDYFYVNTTETSDGLYKGEVTLNEPLADNTYNFILVLQVQEKASTRMVASAIIYVDVVTPGQQTTSVSTPGTTTLVPEADPAPSTDAVNVAAIALGIVVALLLVIILLLILYIVRKRNSKEEDHYAHLSANRAPSRTYNVISNGNTPQEANGRTNAAAVYELEKNPDMTPKVPPRPNEDYDVPEGAYVDIIG